MPQKWYDTPDALYERQEDAAVEQDQLSTRDDEDWGDEPEDES